MTRDCHSHEIITFQLHTVNSEKLEGFYFHKKIAESSVRQKDKSLMYLKRILHECSLFIEFIKQNGEKR